MNNANHISVTIKPSTMPLFDITFRTPTGAIITEPWAGYVSDHAVERFLARVEYAECVIISVESHK